MKMTNGDGDVREGKKKEKMRGGKLRGWKLSKVASIYTSRHWTNGIDSLKHEHV
jgi:hypothetical protein